MVNIINNRYFNEKLLICKKHIFGLTPRVHCFSLKKVCNKFSLAMKLFEIICFFSAFLFCEFE